MGFGLLFIGYFITMVNGPLFGLLGTLVRLGGCALMIYAAVKLRAYNRAFDLTVIGAAIMAAMTLVLIAINADSMLYDSLLIKNKLFSDNTKNIIGYAEQGVSFVFNSLLLWGIFKISKETDVKKISVGAVRNYIFIAAYYVIYLISVLPFGVIQSVRSEFAVVLWILYFTWIGLNAWLLFDCYARICDESDVEMEKKSSSIPFVNKLQEEFDKRSQKAREADALYRQERKMKKEEKKKRRKK